MQKIIKNINETEQNLEIILSAEEFGSEYNQELEEARRNVQIKGFRKGHAPIGLVKKLVGPSIETTIAEKMASKYFAEIAEAESIKPANRAQIIDFSFTEEQLTIQLAYEIQPEFELKDFSGYTFTKAKYTVTEADIEREMTLILKSHGSLISVDEAALSTDTVIGDVWKLNEAGEPDEEQKTSNHHFSLEYLPEANPFRTALTGKKAGETVAIENKELDEETAPTRYRVTISEVKRLELPEVNDELVKEITHQQFETVTDFKADITNQLQTHFNKKAEEELIESISAKMIEENPVPTPASLVDSFSHMLMENAKRQIGGNFPKHFDESEFRETLRPNAIKHAQWMLISQKVAETNNLEISDEDIKTYIEKQAEKMPEAEKAQLLASYESQNVREYVSEMIFKEKIYNVLKSSMTITEEEKAIPATAEEE